LKFGDRDSGCKTLPTFCLVRLENAISSADTCRLHAGEAIRLLADFWPRWRARCRVNPQTADFIIRSLIIGSLMARRWFIDANEHGRARENIVPSLNRDHLRRFGKRGAKRPESSTFYRSLPPPSSVRDRTEKKPVPRHYRFRDLARPIRHGKSQPADSNAKSGTGFSTIVPLVRDTVRAARNAGLMPSAIRCNYFGARYAVGSN